MLSKDNFTDIITRLVGAMESKRFRKKYGQLALGLFCVGT